MTLINCLHPRVQILDLGEYIPRPKPLPFEPTLRGEYPKTKALTITIILFETFANSFICPLFWSNHFFSLVFGKGWGVWKGFTSLIAADIFTSISFFELGYRMAMVTYLHMKIVLHVSFLLLQLFLECLEWYLEMLASWMTTKIHFENFQILHNNALTSCVVETRMEAFALAYLAFFQSAKL